MLDPSPRHRWHTVAEVAELLGMGEAWVRERIKSGELAAKVIHRRGNGEYRISDMAVDAFMESLPDAVPSEELTP